MPRTERLFVRGRDVVRVTRVSRAEGAGMLTVEGPGPARVSCECLDEAHCKAREEEVERSLASTGYVTLRVFDNPAKVLPAFPKIRS